MFLRFWIFIKNQDVIAHWRDQENYKWEIKLTWSWKFQVSVKHYSQEEVLVKRKYGWSLWTRFIPRGTFHFIRALLWDLQYWVHTGFLVGKCCSFPSFTQIFIGCNHVGKFKVRLCLRHVVSPVVGKSLENIPRHRRKIPLSLDNVSSLLRACIRDCNIANCVLTSRKPILDSLSGF